MDNNVAWVTEKDCLSLTGPLNFNTVASLYDAVQSWLIKHHHVEINCSGITQCDSSGLVLLLEWQHLMRKQGRQLHFSHLPQQVQAMARMAHVEHLL
ncbi:MAG: STAS domain-containing protein [Gammaproteobacteria bacterium]